MQTAHANRQTRARGIVVALYRGKVVTQHSGSAVECRPGGRGGSPRARVRAREAESWREAGGKLEICES